MSTRPSTQELEIEGHQLVVRSFNPDASGPPIILIHAGLATVYAWTSDQIPMYAGFGPCNALSLPGHYPARFPPDFRHEALTAELLARLTVEAVRRLSGGRPAVLVGHGSGGLVALAAAAHAPEIARAVVSVSGFAQGRWTGAPGRYQTLAARGALPKSLFKFGLAITGESRRLYRAASRSCAGPQKRQFDYPPFERVLDINRAAFRRLDLEAMAVFFAAMAGVDIQPALRRIVAPTLVISGGADPVVPAAQPRLIAEQVPFVQHVSLPGIGHMPMFEAPERYRREVHDWLVRHVTGR